MKKILGLCLLLVLPTFANDEEQYFNAIKTMITKTTQLRIKAVHDNDFDTVCNAINSNAGTDTMVYYLSFEGFDNAKTAKRLYADLGPFAARSYEKMHRQRLPQQLHKACINDNYAEIRAVMSKIESIYAEE